MLKFAFLGFGQYGGRQVDELLPLSDFYKGMAVNTAENDLTGLKNVPDGLRFQLRGNSFGAGRTPDLAYQAFLDNGAEFMESAQEVTAGADFIWAVAGLGGGTGTGVLKGFLEFGTELFSQPIGLIVTIPRDDDGAVQKANAMDALQVIQKSIDDKKIGAVLIVDNDRFYKQFAEEKREGDWRDHSNVLLANTLHSLNRITTESGHSNFDRTDLLKLLCSSGCLAVGSASLRDIDQESVYSVIRNSIHKGFFASGYRLEEAEYYSICFTLNESGSVVRSSNYEQFFVTHLKSIFKNAVDSFFGYYSNGKNHVLSVISGLGLPDRVFGFTEQIKAIESRQTKRFEGVSVPDLNANNPLLRPKAAVVVEDNPLLRKRSETSATNNPLVSNNPLLRKK